MCRGLKPKKRPRRVAWLWAARAVEERAEVSAVRRATASREWGGGEQG